MDTVNQFSNLQTLKEISIGSDEMMVALINMLSSSIKTYYKKTKTTLKEIDFGINNINNNKEKLDLIEHTLKNFLLEAKDIFLHLKTNRNQGKIKNNESDKSNHNIKVGNKTKFPSKSTKCKLEITTKFKNYNEKNILSLSNNSICSSIHTNNSNNINKNKFLHKSNSTKSSNCKSVNNESICLTQQIILKIKELFLNGKQIPSNGDTNKINTLLSLLNQYIKLLKPINESSTSNPVKSNSKNKTGYLSPMQSPTYTNINSKICIEGLSSRYNKKINIANHKHKRNNSNSVSTTKNMFININDNFPSTTKNNSSKQEINNNIKIFHSQAYLREDSVIKLNYDGNSSKYENGSAQNVQKNKLVEKEFELKNQDTQLNNNSINNNQDISKINDYEKNSQNNNSLLDKCSNLNLKITSENISYQNDSNFQDNEVRLKNEINELDNLLIQKQQIIDDNINKNKNRIFVINNIFSLSYNIKNAKNNGNPNLREIKQHIVSQNEIVNFHFSLENDLSINNLNQIKEQLAQMQTEKDKLQEEIKVLSDKHNIQSESYEHLLNNLSHKELYLTQSNEEIKNLTKEIKSLQFKVFHLESQNNERNFSPSPYSKGKNQTVVQKSQYNKLSQEDLIKNIEILKTENDKFAKQCAKLQNEINKTNKDYVDLQASFIQLKNFFEKESKDNVTSISDLKETIKHKSEMLLFQSIQLETLETTNKKNESKIEELIDTVKKNEKVINDLNMINKELTIQKEDLAMKYNIMKSLSTERNNNECHFHSYRENGKIIEQEKISDVKTNYNSISTIHDKIISKNKNDNSSEQ